MPLPSSREKQGHWVTLKDGRPIYISSYQAARPTAKTLVSRLRKTLFGEAIVGGEEDGQEETRTP